jgi:hypothetical protein
MEFMSRVPCAVRDCPAFAVSKATTCAIHKTARRADTDGTCPRCHRKITKATDSTDASWVITVPIMKRNRKGRETTVYREAHAYCPPRVPRVKKRDEPKALIEAIEAAS